MFSQIGRTLEYCEKYDRFLYIDTDLHGFFGEPFWNYFVAHDFAKGTTNVTRHTLKGLDSRTCFPNEIRGKLLSYKHEQIPGDTRRAIGRQYGHFVNLRDKETKTPLTFMMNQPYEEEVLIHHCSGFDLRLASRALEFLCPTKRIGEEVKKLSHQLHRPWRAVHVRNTDLKTDYESISEVCFPKVVGTIIAFSDDASAVKRLRECSPQYDIRQSPSWASMRRRLRLNCSRGKPLHKGNGWWRGPLNEAAILDLFLMSIADTVHSLPLKEGQSKQRSGYVRLASRMKRDGLAGEKIDDLG